MNFMVMFFACVQSQNNSTVVISIGNLLMGPKVIETNLVSGNLLLTQHQGNLTSYII